MASENFEKARKNEVAYCGNYCRTCYWYTDALRKPATQLLDLIKSHFELAGWINAQGSNAEQTIKGLEILSKTACAFKCKGGSGWGDCPVRKCCITKGVDFCFECSEFPCTLWDEKGKYAHVFNRTKIERLQKMKELGVEEWIKKQWE
ncbi:MAG: DUF3795 domain-containing protein [Candidatus Bathyarchaeia archaeon]